MSSDRHIDPELLAQQAVDGVPAWEINTVYRHLAHCDTCAEAYLRLRLASSVFTTVAPKSIWPAIQSRLNVRQASHANSRRFPAAFRVLAFGTMVAALVVVSAALLMWRQNLHSSTLDIGHYLSVLETSNVGPSVENLHTVFPAFSAYDRSEAPPTNVRADMANYRLVEQRTWFSPAKILQLVYASDDDVVALFIAPRTAKIDFERYHLAAIELNGMRCRRVLCPRQDVYWLTSGARQYIFVRRHSSSGDSGQLFMELIGGTP